MLDNINFTMTDNYHLRLSLDVVDRTITQRDFNRSIDFRCLETVHLQSSRLYEKVHGSIVTEEAR